MPGWAAEAEDQRQLPRRCQTPACKLTACTPWTPPHLCQDAQQVQTRAVAQVLDFNLAKSVHQPQGWVADTPCGTSPYIAPEVLSHQRYSQACPPAISSHGTAVWQCFCGLRSIQPRLHSHTAGLTLVKAMWRLQSSFCVLVAGAAAAAAAACAAAGMRAAPVKAHPPPQHPALE